MSKVIICLTAGLLIAFSGLRAQDTPGHATDTSRQTPVADSSMKSPDTTVQVKDTAIVSVKDTTSPAVKDTAVLAQNTPAQVSDTTPPANNNAVDTASQSKEAPKPADDAALQGTGKREVDTRWFISPLLKGQFQDFGMLEKNRKGYLSDANTLPFSQRGNGSFAASAYKNITGRLAISADLGLSFGHVTNNDVLISQTKSKTYNLLNAAVYYHLLSAAYRLQPYITVGINDLINDASYLSAPMGIGAKFNSKKIMVLGQLTYGYGVNKNTANTTMYSLGIYIPLKNKKQKKEEAEDQSPYNRNKKDDDKKKDTTSKNGGGIVNNIYITINMDSVLRAKGLLNDDGSPSGVRRKGGGSDDDGDEDGSGGGKRSGKRKGLRSSLNLDDDLAAEDFKVDTINGVPVIRFVVYFEFNEYGLNSKAFASIDRVIGHLRQKPDLSIEIKGYTDDVGTESYNNFLSRRRAKMVLDYLNSRGVPSELMKAKAYGSDNPVADNKNPNQAWLNRRAEIIVHEK